MTESGEHEQQNPGGEGEQLRFDGDLPHHNIPRLRAVRGFPVQKGDQVAIGLADAQQISQRVVFAAPAVQVLLEHLDGKNDIDTIVDLVGRGLTREMLEQFVAQLDSAGLLFGPTFDGILAKMREEFDSQPNLPPASTAMIADMFAREDLGGEATAEEVEAHGPEALRSRIEGWINGALEDVDDPSFDALPAAVVAPHLDYQRGWRNYGHVYGRMRVTERPDRIIILGTNHFGRSTGVCGCDKGFESPFGLCELDREFVDALTGAMGEDVSQCLFAERFDHEREHSIELHIPWIQHVFGPDESGSYPKIFGALVHDPSVNNGESYDGAGVDLLPFVDALRTAIDSSDGRTLVVCSADLSHVGPQFGDQVRFDGEDPNADAIAEKVDKHDTEMLALFGDGKAEELVASMAWQQNPTRWCSIGAMTATLKAVSPATVKQLHYYPAVDDGGTAMVSSVACAIF
jgi:AmmeMemoRadiSam system protein B